MPISSLSSGYSKYVVMGPENRPMFAEDENSAMKVAERFSRANPGCIARIFKLDTVAKVTKTESFTAVYEKV